MGRLNSLFRDTDFEKLDTSEEIYKFKNRIFVPSV